MVFKFLTALALLGVVGQLASGAHFIEKTETVTTTIIEDDNYDLADNIGADSPVLILPVDDASQAPTEIIATLVPISGDDDEPSSNSSATGDSVGDDFLDSDFDLSAPPAPPAAEATTTTTTTTTAAEAADTSAAAASDADATSSSSSSSTTTTTTAAAPTSDDEDDSVDYSDPTTVVVVPTDYYYYDPDLSTTDVPYGLPDLDDDDVDTAAAATAAAVADSDSNSSSSSAASSAASSATIVVPSDKIIPYTITVVPPFTGPVGDNFL